VVLLICAGESDSLVALLQRSTSAAQLNNGSIAVCR
jgi:hypothetical protein